MTPQQIARELFEPLDRAYPRDALVNAHCIAILVQLYKSNADQRRKLSERFLSELQNWSAWADRDGKIYEETQW